MIENKENMERYKELSHKIDEWLVAYDAPFDTEKVWRQFNVLSRVGKENVHKVLSERIKSGILEFKLGKYRKIDTIRKPIDFRTANITNFVPLKFPRALIGKSTFGLEKLVRIFPKGVIVIAGVKGGTKTAFCLNIAKENMNDPELSLYLYNDAEQFIREPMVAYFTNELSPEELADRLSSFADVENGLDNLYMWNILSEERYSNFADVIYPDKINIIDALEQNTEAYIVADLIDAIHQKLNKGIAIIAMHKNFNAEYAAGGIYSAKKARLYLVLQNNILKVKHSKKTVDGQTAEGKAWSFKLVGGARYTQIMELENEILS